MGSSKLNVAHEHVGLESVSNATPKNEPTPDGSDKGAPGHFDHDPPEPRILLRGVFVQVLDRRDYPSRYSNIVEFQTRDAQGMDWKCAGGLWTSEWEELYELIEDRVLQTVCDAPRDFGFHAFER